jgi:hypothetical protein
MTTATERGVRCSDVLWAGLQCELGHGHPGDHRGTATAKDGSGDTMPVEWNDPDPEGEEAD